MYSLSEVVAQKIKDVELLTALVNDYRTQELIVANCKRKISSSVKNLKNHIYWLNETHTQEQKLSELYSIAWGNKCPIKSLWQLFGSVCINSKGELIQTYTIQLENDIEILKSILS